MLDSIKKIIIRSNEELIKDTLEVLELNRPLLEKIYEIFGVTNIPEILENIVISDFYADISETIIENIIYSCLPKSPLYRDIVKLIKIYNISYQSSSRYTYRVSVCDKKEQLRKMDSYWVYQNMDQVEKFMGENEIYNKLKLLEDSGENRSSYFKID